MKRIFFSYSFALLSVFLLVFGMSFLPKTTEAQTANIAQEIVSILRSNPSLLSQVVSLRNQTPSQGFVFNRDIYPGNENEDVRQLQRFLNSDSNTRLNVAAGEPGSSGFETNRLGPASVEALRRFQAKHSLAVTGIFSGATRALVNSLSGSLSQGNLVPSAPVAQYKTINIDFSAPRSFCETDGSPNNPFLDYRLDVTFSNGSTNVSVPGYFAGDGNGNGCGNVWRVHFVPNAGGSWTYRPTMYYGSNIAVADSVSGAETVNVGQGGTVQATSASGDSGFLSKGMLRYVNERYLRFDDGEYFLKAGAGSPENFLAYAGFDGGGRHRYDAHSVDYNIDPVPGWGNSGQANNIIGTVNYLTSQGINSMYMLTMNVGGDGDDVYPWVSKSNRNNFDISKLWQWNTLFDHMDRRGMALHLITQEQENDRMLNGGNLGNERKLYYRELIARFAHHRAVTWNLGEENWNTNDQKRSFVNYIKSINPYNQNIVVHNHINQGGWTISSTFNSSMVGYLTGASMQSESARHVPADTVGRLQTNPTWVVTSDEIGHAGCGVIPDGSRPNNNRNCSSQEDVRKYAIWGNLMNGGSGFDHYFGYDYPNDDLDLETFRTRQNIWNYSRYAINFFKENNVPFWELTPNSSSFLNLNGGWGMSKNGEWYVAYLPNGSTNISVNLSNYGNKFIIKWFDPTTGVYLNQGEIDGGAIRSVAYSDSNKEVAILISNSGGVSPILPIVPIPPITSTVRGFIESGGFVVMEVESTPPVESWQSRTSIPGYSGSSYYVWEGSDHLNETGRGILQYTFVINNPGNYRVYLRSMKNARANDQENDIWIKMENNADTQVHKLYKGGNRNVWEYSNEFSDYINGVETQYPARFYLPAGQHTLTFSARSRSFEIDKIVLVKQELEGQANDRFLDSLPESVSGGSTIPEVDQGIPVDGVTIDVSIAGSQFSQGQGVPITLNFKNNSGQLKNLSLDHSCRTGNFRIKRGNQVVFDSFNRAECGTTPSSLTLGPNGSLVSQKVFNTGSAGVRLSQGSYTVEGYLYGYAIPTNSASFSIFGEDPSYDDGGGSGDGSGEGVTEDEESGSGDDDDGKSFGGITLPYILPCLYPFDGFAFWVLLDNIVSAYVVKASVAGVNTLAPIAMYVLGTYDGETRCATQILGDGNFEWFGGRNVTDIEFGWTELF